MGRVFSSSSVLVLASVSLCLLHLSIGLWLNTEEPVGEITDTPALLHYPRSAARVSVRLSSRLSDPEKGLDWKEKESEKKNEGKLKKRESAEKEKLSRDWLETDLNQYSSCGISILLSYTVTSSLFLPVEFELESVACMLTCDAARRWKTGPGGSSIDLGSCSLPSLAIRLE